MITLVTLNINYDGDRHGPWEARRLLIEQALERTYPDILLLQAVLQDPTQFRGEDQASQLSSLLPDFEHVYFVPAETLPGRIVHGSAILARLPFAARDSLTLNLRPGLDDTHQRTVVYSRFDLPGGPLHVFNAHFSWNPEQGKDNLEETLPFIDSVKDPALLAGDFNIPPESGLLDILRRAGWVDAWEHLRPGEAGHTFEAHRPTTRIDYLWANPALAPHLKGIERLRYENGSIRLSDHLGLRVELDL